MSGFPEEMEAEEYAGAIANDNAGEDEAPPLSARDQVIESIRAKKGQAEIEAVNDNDDEPQAEDTYQNDRSDEPEDEEIYEAQAPQKHKLRVDHRDIEVTQQELEAAARQHYAAENRLAELNALKQQTAAQLAEMRALKENLARAESSSPQRPTTPNTDAGRETPPRALGNLRDIVEKIQLGDADEGAEALQSLLQEMRPNQAVNAEQIAERALALQAERQQQREVADRFAEDHREIVNDPHLMKITVDRLHERIVEDMAAIGVQPVHLDQARRDFKVATAYHQDLRNQGYAKLRDPALLVKAAALDVEGRYVAPRRNEEPQSYREPAAPRYDDRRAAKRELSGSQPRRVSQVARAPERPAKVSATSVVEQMRRARGHVN